MSCVFCEIAAGSRPAHLVVEQGDVIAFLDTRPVFKGHVLVVPRRHVATLDVLPDDALGPLWSTVQRVVRAIYAAGLAQGTFVAVNNVVSQSVPHLHVHVVPRNAKDGLRGFFWPRVKYASEDEMVSTAAKIRAAV